MSTLAIDTLSVLERPVPQSVSVTIIAQDPSVRVGGSILTAQVRIPAEHLDPGPRGARFHVVDYDGATGTLLPPAVLAPEVQDRFADAADAELTGDAEFRAQNVYAIAARTLAGFEAALGRRLGWGFDGHQLFLVPHAIAEANAYYAPEDGAIYFGYVPREDGELQTALSHDIVAHETTHAILDGLRPLYAEPGLPDQPAFHEALADVVALLSLFSIPGVAARLLDPSGDGGRLAAERLTPDALRRSALLTLAEQLGDHDGDGAGSERGGGLRRSVELLPTTTWRAEREFAEPHRRAEVLVAAVTQTLLRMWTSRLPAIAAEDGSADRARVAEEGATAAAHLLRMAMRGVDYLPPVELEYEDVLDAILKADEVVAPDDEHGYRDALHDAFAAFGIERPSGRLIDVSRSGRPVYERMNFAILRSDRDEVFRFLWENADVFELDRECGWLRVESVRPSVRVGPDGLVVPEVVASYVQTLELTAGELAARGATVPGGLPPETKLQLRGGGVVVFDQFGRAKLHQHKRLDDWDRQTRRLAYLVAYGLVDSRGRFGFTLSQPRGQRFAALHVAAGDEAERW